LGIDFIQKHQLWYCPKNHSFDWEGQPNWEQGHLKVCNATVIPPLSVAYLKATICTEGGTLPVEGNQKKLNGTSLNGSSSESFSQPAAVTTAPFSPS